jgi:DNA-binding transcriptional regulator YdaS (Cro superfamily)
MELGRWLDKTDRTIAGFAAEGGFHVSSVYRWLAGERTPSAEALVTIERISRGAVRAKDFLSPRRR